MTDPVESKDGAAVVFLCGPNRTCEHTMDKYEPLYDEKGRECGSTLVCSKCGETAFNQSMWSDF